MEIKFQITTTDSAKYSDVLAQVVASGRTQLPITVGFHCFEMQCSLYRTMHRDGAM